MAPLIVGYSAKLSLTSHGDEENGIPLTDLRALVTELAELSGSCLAPASYKATEFSLNFAPFSEEDRQGILEVPMDVIPPDISVDGVTVTAELTLPHGEAVKDAWGIESALVDGLEVFEQAIGTAVTAMLIAAPGNVNIHFDEVFPILDGVPWKDELGRDPFRAGGFAGVPSRNMADVCKVALDYRWPPIRRLPIRTVSEWIVRLPGWKEGIGRNQAGRALASFQRVIGDDSELDTQDLFWAMMGLEAVYTSKNGSLADQLLRHSETLLGPRLEFKRVFKDMYETRSRLIHGDQDIPLRYVAGEGENVFPEHVLRATRIAVAMLIATLQEFVARDWTSLQFLTTVAGMRESP